MLAYWTKSTEKLPESGRTGTTATYMSLSAPDQFCPAETLVAQDGGKGEIHDGNFAVFVPEGQ